MVQDSRPNALLNKPLKSGVLEQIKGDTDNWVYTRHFVAEGSTSLVWKTATRHKRCLWNALTGSEPGTRARLSPANTLAFNGGCNRRDGEAENKHLFFPVDVINLCTWWHRVVGAADWGAKGLKKGLIDISSSTFRTDCTLKTVCNQAL